MDYQLREYIKGLTVVVEEHLEVPSELALTGQQFLTTAPSGQTQVMNGGSLLATTAFGQPVQIQSTPQLVHHPSGQLIPLQILPSQRTIVQLPRTQIVTDINELKDAQVQDYEQAMCEY